ncbi:MAG: Ku protein [Candidatus Methanomethylicus sp.]|nr:Ku protein [Candidatus Methanomethylicus sp.]
MAEDESDFIDAKGAEAKARRSIWSGSISIGLVNVPVKLYSMTKDRSFSFRLLHKADGQPLRYDRVCIKEGKVIPWEETVKGYEVRKGEFIVFDKKELEAARPESDSRIRIDKFVDYLAVDPIYWDTPYLLAPDKSGDAYSLLLTTFQKLGKAGVGRITLRTKEYPVLVHASRGALLLTTLRYADEVLPVKGIEGLDGLREPRREELEMAERIVKDLSGDFDIADYKDGFRERIMKLIDKKLAGEIVVTEKPKKEEAKELMAALQETLAQLKKKGP